MRRDCGQEASGLQQRGLDQVLRQHVALHESVEPVARVVRVQRDDAVERLHPDLGFEEAHLRLVRLLPELAVQVASAPGMPVFVEVGGIADRVDEQRVAFGDLRVLLQGMEEARQGERTLGSSPWIVAKIPIRITSPPPLGPT